MFPPRPSTHHPERESGAWGGRIPSIELHFGGRCPPMAAIGRAPGDMLSRLVSFAPAKRRHYAPLSYHVFGRKFALAR